MFIIVFTLNNLKICIPTIVKIKTYYVKYIVKVNITPYKCVIFTFIIQLLRITYA